MTDVSALVTAHEETLRRDGFVLNGTVVRYPPNTGNLTTDYHTVVGPGGERFSTDVRTVHYATDDGDSPVSQRTRTRLWGNSTATLRRSTVDGSTATGTVEEIPPHLALTRAAQYRSYLRMGAFSVDRVVARGGHTFTTLVANETRDGSGENASFSARLVVDERGVIHEGVVDASRTEPDRQTVHSEYRVVRLGASPERPAWVADASGD